MQHWQIKITYSEAVTLLSGIESIIHEWWNGICTCAGFERSTIKTLARAVLKLDSVLKRPIAC